MNHNFALVNVALVCIAGIWSATPTLAQEAAKELKLKPPAIFLGKQNKTAQQMTSASFGAVTILEVSFARRIKAEDSTVPEVKEFASDFDFYLVPLKFGVVGFDGRKCQSLQIGANLRVANGSAEQALLLSVFPQKATAPGLLKSDGKIIVGADLEAKVPERLPVGASVSVDGKLTVEWTWNPLYQAVASAHDQTRVIWRFDRVGADFPVGPIDVGAVIAVAKDRPRNLRIAFETELQASFDGGIWKDNVAVARGSISVRLP